MAVHTCPRCGQQTFFATPTGRKCTKCGHEMKVPANNGMGGKGQQCKNCGQFTVFSGKCRSCGAIYS